jgi:DMSO/TMAO reductase YedYZ molybdopterin-dependent catalytic subunit
VHARRRSAFEPMPDLDPTDGDPHPTFSSSQVRKLVERRRFIRNAATGTAVAVLGGYYYLSDELTREAQAQTLGDGRPRVPPGQRVLKAWRAMGGEPGDPSLEQLKLRVHGEVEAPYTLSYADLKAMPQTSTLVDVHCVTGWTVLDAKVKGVLLKDLVERAKLKPSARHVILEAAHGYTANVPLREVLGPKQMVCFELGGAPLPRAHGGPLRALVPDLYFWKSAKWLTGIKLVTRDEPGYWEMRGYHNHGDPWREERYG